MSDGVHRQMPDGSWAPAEPLGYLGTPPDFEMVRAGRRLVWIAYDGAEQVGQGSARTRLGALWARWRFARRYRKDES